MLELLLELGLVREVCRLVLSVGALLLLLLECRGGVVCATGLWSFCWSSNMPCLEVAVCECAHGSAVARA